MKTNLPARPWALGAVLLLGALAGCDFEAEHVVEAEQEGGIYSGCATPSGRCFFLNIYSDDGRVHGGGAVDADNQPWDGPSDPVTLEGTRIGQRLTFAMQREGEAFGTFDGDAGGTGWGSFSGRITGGELNGEALVLARQASMSNGW